MDERRQELGLTWTEVARRAGLSPEALRLIRTKEADIQRSSKDGIELALRWTSGSIDAILSDDDTAPWPAVEPAEAAHEAVSVAESTFPEALDAYREALQRLKRSAITDPKVPSEVVDIIEDWDMMLTALQYGGVTAVFRALADSYNKRQVGENPSHRAG